MDSESRNLQNEFFNAARKERATVTVFLGNGKRLIGRLKSFDRFTLLLEGQHGEQMVFKHAISTISTTSRTVENGSDSSQGARAAVGQARD